ncbi:Iron-regulated protein A precursor [Enhygromyxa salina]|uniref:Iron-regulated protein A n=1 Tax=Enhygromyxa salina TaxID=215803 RepID=A0A2S9XEI6_9BACT|nr:imelysin family protein [Enhygromyxa salina]PRP91091.1 Iron-regulated protein A precursor [Enhygromyxa salina]
MTRSRPWLLTGLGLLGLGLGAIAQLGCPEVEDDRRGEVAQTTAELLLQPDLAEARARALTLREAATSLCAGPGPTSLDAAQEAWWELREPWKRLRALPLGPIVDEGFDSAIDFWPARPTSVEGGVELGVSNQTELDTLGVASKGLPAIEYLLWDPVNGDEAILASLTDPELGAARCDYVVVLAADLELRFELLDSATAEFADALATAGSSERFPTLAVAIDELLNAAIAGLHDISEREFGKPLGLSTGTEPQPDQLESRFSDRSRTDVRAAVEGFRRFYLGAEAGVGEAPGLTALVSQANAEIDARVREQLATTVAAVEAMPEPMRTIMEVDPDAAAAARDAVLALRQLLAADVAGLLGVTVSLSDNDGD